MVNSSQANATQLPRVAKLFNHFLDWLPPLPAAAALLAPNQGPGGPILIIETPLPPSFLAIVIEPCFCIHAQISHKVRVHLRFLG